MEGNQVRIAIREAGSTDNWKILRRTNDALTAGAETTRSEEIRSDRKRGDQKITTLTVGGTLDFEMSFDSFREILSGAMMMSWAQDTPTTGTNQLTVGTTTRRFDLLKSYMDTGNHVLMKNMEVGQLSLSMSAGSRITGQVTFQGTEAVTDYDPSTDTFDDPLTTQIMDSSNNLGSIMLDESAISGLCITDLSLDINNNHTSDQCLATQYQEHWKGSANITGSMTIRASSAAFAEWEKTITNTPISLSYTLSDPAGNEYKFALDKAYLSGDLPSGGLDSILTFGLNLTAAVGDTSGEMLTIEETPAT